MGLKLKEGKTFNNPYNGEITTAYLNIKQINGNDSRKDKVFTIEIYTSEDYKETGARPIHSESVTVTGDEWATWFHPEVLASADCNQNKQSYAYTLQLEHNTGTEEEPVMELVWGDWENTEDEV